MVIDGYTHNSSLSSGGSVPLGTQLIFVCQAVGLPYGTSLRYTWTCPFSICEEEGYAQKIYNGHILEVNVTSASDEGMYTCQVTAQSAGGQAASGNFSIRVTGTYVCPIHLYHIRIAVLLTSNWYTTPEQI